MNMFFLFINLAIGFEYMISMLTDLECLQRKDVWASKFWLSIIFWKHFPPNSAHY